MNILIDDVRFLLPDKSTPDVIIRSFDAAEIVLAALIGEGGLYKCGIYLDHDLGDSNETHNGYGLITMIEENIFWYGESAQPHKIICVSDNGAGRLRIEQVIQNLYGHLFYD